MLSFVCTAAAEWNEQVLYSFQGGTSDGFWPAGGVVFDKAGNLYGATEGAGPSSCYPDANLCGLVYELSPPAKKGNPWTETILIQFKGKQSNDVSLPSSGLIMDVSGNLYGVSAYGGTGDCVILGTPAGCGTVYELSPPKQKGDPWTEAILYGFNGGNDGYFPAGNLTFDKAGNLYGATNFGGGKGNTCNIFFGGNCGIVFKLSPPKQKGGAWTEQVLHSFAGGTDGAIPNGALVIAKSGVIYGTTPAGGNQGCKNDIGVGCGTAFKLTPTKKGTEWKEKMLYRFTGSDDGAAPNGGLVLDHSGTLFGTAGGGGAGKSGVVFQLKVNGGGSAESVLYSFTGNAGGNPTAGLTLSQVGDLYGAALGGQYFRGVVFRMRMKAGVWAFSDVYTLKGAPDAGYPEATLVRSASGSLYGTSHGGGTGQACQGGCGTVFEVFP